MTTTQEQSRTGRFVIKGTRPTTSERVTIGQEMTYHAATLRANYLRDSGWQQVTIVGVAPAR